MTTTLRSTALPYAAHLASISLAQPGFEMRRVASREDWKGAKSVRYDALRSREEIPDSPERSYGDPHDNGLNTMAFVLTRNARPVGTTRSSVSSARRRWALPAMDVFAREIEA